MHCVTTLNPAPAGFVRVKLSKAVLLSGPVAVAVDSLAEVAEVLEDYSELLRGMVVSPCSEIVVKRLSSLTWHVMAPRERMGELVSMVEGWLTAVKEADIAMQGTAVAEIRKERIMRELEATRHDYNMLTGRLHEQVRDLTAAKAELSELNESLEQRVERRTVDLAVANMRLSSTLDELTRTQNELVRAGQLAGLGTLVAGIAHELNTPIGNALTVVTTLSHETQLFDSRYREGGLKRSALEVFVHNADEAAVVIERNLQRAAGIIGHFKQLSRDQASETRRRFRLAEVVSDTLSALSPQLRKAPYIVALELDRSLEMESYPGAISQILTNLVNNALVHAFEGRSNGKMTIRSMAANDDELLLTFEDDGNGIAADKLEHIFEPFYTSKFGQGGSGLGLYMVYNQVHRILGGRVEFTSEVGQGTSFRLTLPCIAPDSGATLC